jgi:hypothetical protein
VRRSLTAHVVADSLLNPRQKPDELQMLAGILGPAFEENTQVTDCTKFSNTTPRRKASGLTVPSEKSTCSAKIWKRTAYIGNDDKTVTLLNLERAMGIEPTSEAWEANNKIQNRWIWRHF